MAIRQPLIDCLIFSKDRPAQLDLLLRSIQRYAPNLYRSITVLWTASGPEFVKGYEHCWWEHPQGITRWDELPDWFEQHVRGWLEHAAGPVSFLCDDDVFYRDAAPPERLPWSYRGGDYDYPFSLDGNVYKKAEVLALLDGLRFTNPTELEATAHDKRARLPFDVVYHGTPCLVGIPANRVSVSSGMPYMGQHEYDLNERYLRGERLRLLNLWSDPPHGVKVNGFLPAHAEIPLMFA